MPKPHKQNDDKPLPLESIGLIAIDLDGTLLRSDDTLGTETGAAIAEALAQGVKVVICTARPPRGTKAIYDSLGLDTLVINHNGAVIQDPIEGKVWFHEPMKGSLAKQVVQLARNVDSDLAVGVEVYDTFHIDRKSKRLAEEVSLGAGDEQPNAFDTLFEQPITKIALVGKSGSLGGVQMALMRVGSGRVGIAYSNMRLLQVMHHGVDKASGLKRVANYYGIPPERVMAIGDAPNDIPMINWAGLGVVVENCWDEARRHAQMIVPSNDNDGVATAIRRYALQ